jgi:CheY-like chemotaxis protein
MDAATTVRIFEPFFTTKPVGQGTGLGLASVYGTVKQSGGLIWVDSEPGRGTSFTIDVPQVVAVQAPAPPAGVPTAVVASATGDGSISILLVDDEVMVRHVTGRALRELGYGVIEASDGREALRLISEEHAAVDLVLSDVVMPGMSGAELWNRLAESHPGLPVLLMSGYASEDLVRQGRLDAGTPVLAKPFTVAELSARINHLLHPRA